LKRLALAALVLVAGLACDADRRPVGSLAAAPGTILLPWPEFAEVALEVEPLAALPEEVRAPKLFVHLIDETGAVVRTFDQAIGEPWREGRAIRTRIRVLQSALAEPLPAGDYDLTVGLYDPESGRFPLDSELELRGRFEYLAATVRVPAVGREAPQARFSPDWLPAEAGGDRQVVVRRTLRGDAVGRIQLGPLAGPATVALALFVPNEIGIGSRLEIVDGGSQPKLRLVSSCGAEELELSGTGRFDADFRIPAGFGPAVCDVTVEPNFRLTTSDRAETTSVRLESVAWRAGASGSDDAPAR